MAACVLGIATLIGQLASPAQAAAVTTERHRVYASWSGGTIGGPTAQFPDTFGDLDVTNVSFSDSTTVPQARFGTVCAVASGYVYCWGANNLGQVGDGTTAFRSSPALVSAASGLPQGQVTQIVNGYRFTCALAQGGVWCWGDGAAAQLANGGGSSLVPVAIGGTLSGKTVDEIAGGDQNIDSGYMLARVRGAVYQWGSVHDHLCWPTVCVTTTPTPSLIVGAVASSSAERIYFRSGVATVLTSGAVWQWGQVNWRSTDVSAPVEASPTGPDGNPITGLSQVAVGGSGRVLAAIKNGTVVVGDPTNALAGVPVTKIAASEFGGGAGVRVAAITASGQLWVSADSVARELVRKDQYGGVVDVTFSGNYQADYMFAAVVAPGTPSAVAATAANASATVTWSAPTDSGGAHLSGYKVRRYEDGGPTTTVITPSPSTTYTDTGLTAGKAYSYSVAATTIGGDGEFSSPSNTVFPGSTQPPNANTGVTINSGANYTNTKAVDVNISWPANAVAMRVSNDGGFLPGLTQTFSPTTRIPWQLDDSVKGLYTKIVYVRFDGYGIDSTRTYTDDIILDVTAPQMKSAGFARAAGSRVTVTTKATDNTSGVGKLQVAKNRAGSSAVTIRYAKKATVKIAGSNRTLFVRVQDRAGNWSTWKSARLR